MDTLDADLRCAGEMFLHHRYCVINQSHDFNIDRVFIDLAKKEVTIPKLFSIHRKDFGETDQDILMWLFQFLCTKKRLELALLLGINDLLFIF
jgi:DNA replication protein DnaD